MNRTLIISVIFFYQLTIVKSQVFTLYEKDRYSSDQPTPPISDNDIVDINAILEIHLNKDSISRAISELGDEEDAISLLSLNQIKAVLTNQEKLLALFPAFKDNTDLQQVMDFSLELNRFIIEINKIPEMQDLYDALSEQYFLEYQDRPPGMPLQDEYVIIEMSKIMSRKTTIMNKKLSDGSISFALSGRLYGKDGPRSVKLSDDFDEFETDVYKFPKWQTQLSKEGKEQLSEIGAASKSFTSLIEGKSIDLKNWALNSFQATECLNDLDRQFSKLSDDEDNLSQEGNKGIVDDLKNAGSKLKNLISDYKTNLSRISASSPADLLITIDSRISNLASKITGFTDEFEGIPSTEISKLVSQGNENSLSSTYNLCKEKLMADKDKIVNLTGRFTKMLRSSTEIAEATTEISDKVRRLKYNNIPNKSLIHLQHMGRRDNGDRILIQANLLQEGDESDRTLPILLDQRLFYIYQIGIHSTMKPALTLGNPFGAPNDPTDPNAQYLAGRSFQFAPSYTMIFKWGSRKSKNFNDFLNPGIGVNFGAMDFNTDAVPEFTAGLEFSFIKDYFSFGLSYNFGVDASYYFLGLRLPVGAVPLPIFNEVSSN